MYYTGIDPFTLKQVYVPKTYEEKKLQRALLQSSRAENRPLVEKAIRISDRRDAQCLLGHFPVSDNAHKVRKTGMKTASNQKPKKKGGVKKGKGSDTAKLRKALKEKSKIKSK